MAWFCSAVDNAQQFDDAETGRFFMRVVRVVFNAADLAVTLRRCEPGLVRSPSASA